jgi:hypothetical protein
MSTTKARRASSGSMALRGQESAVQKQTMGSILTWLASQPSSILNSIPSIAPPPGHSGFSEWVRAVVSLLTWALETNHELPAPVVPQKIRPITTKAIAPIKPTSDAILSAEAIAPVEPKVSLKGRKPSKLEAMPG